MFVTNLKGFGREQANELIRSMLLPVIAMMIFLGLWSASASQVETSLGQLPGPVAVYQQASNLLDEHFAERDKETAFYQRQEKRNAKKLAENPEAEIKIRPYTGKPTFF